MLSMIIREEIRKTYSNSVKITINMKQERRNIRYRIDLIKRSRLKYLFDHTH